MATRGQNPAVQDFGAIDRQAAGRQMKSWPAVRASLLAKRDLVVLRWKDKVLAGTVSIADTDRMWRLTYAIDEVIEIGEIDAGL
jgi:hypothetical protein